ncbi:hypothetical protein CBER1_11783 [Cercospora berteroae]|uniref:Uncharacterized protein n=1 Tax=Cercospora berteroae TaxID=357750 RepID=A0A2S6BWV2_9PEZI|nr:hypothetical protein CBER1_11783 [Cercospora berteroae]
MANSIARRHSSALEQRLGRSQHRDSLSPKQDLTSSATSRSSDSQRLLEDTAQSEVTDSTVNSIAEPESPASKHTHIGEDGYLEYSTIPSISDEEYERALSRDKVAILVADFLQSGGFRDETKYKTLVPQLNERLGCSREETLGFLNRIARGPCVDTTEADVFKCIYGLEKNSAAEDFSKAATYVMKLRGTIQWAPSNEYSVRPFSHWDDALGVAFDETEDEPDRKEAEATVKLLFGDKELTVMTFGWFKAATNTLEPSTALYVGWCLEEQGLFLVDPTGESKWHGECFTLASITPPDEEWAFEFKSKIPPKVEPYKIDIDRSTSHADQPPVLASERNTQNTETHPLFRGSCYKISGKSRYFSTSYCMS